MSREDVKMEDQVGCDRELDERESEGVVSLDGDMEEMSDEERKQFEADKLASMCYCEKLNSRDEDEDDKPEKVTFADTVVVCPTYTSQVGRSVWIIFKLLIMLRSMIVSQMMTGGRRRELWRRWWRNLTLLSWKLIRMDCKESSLLIFTKC